MTKTLTLDSNGTRIYGAEDALAALEPGDSFTFTYDVDGDRFIEVEKTEDGFVYRTGAGSWNDIGDDELTQKEIDFIGNAISEQMSEVDSSDYWFVLTD